MSKAHPVRRVCGPYRTYDGLIERRRDKGDGSDYRRRPPGDVDIALAIRQERRRRILTQAELAEELGVTRSRLAQWETARRRITVADYECLRAVLPGLPEVRDIWSAHHSERVVVAD